MTPREQIASDTRANIVAMVADFARREVAPGAADRDRGAPFPVDLWHRMGEIGLHGLAVPEEHGGVEADMSTICAAGRAFGRYGGDFGLGLSWLSSNSGTSGRWPIMYPGWLPAS
jgi:alkylation response protein AidB-like acyl-CoA dehydrogenase